MKRHYVWLIRDTLRVADIELRSHLAFEHAAWVVNENHVASFNPQTGQPLKNYRGYDPLAFFAPKASYSGLGSFSQWACTAARSLWFGNESIL